MIIGNPARMKSEMIDMTAMSQHGQNDAIYSCDLLA